MRETRRDALLVQRYATQKSLSLRSGQMHRKQNHPDWVAFHAEATAHEQETAVATLASDEEEAQALQRYQKLDELWA